MVEILRRTLINLSDVQVILHEIYQSIKNIKLRIEVTFYNYWLSFFHFPDVNLISITLTHGKQCMIRAQGR